MGEMEVDAVGEASSCSRSCYKKAHQGPPPGRSRSRCPRGSEPTSQLDYPQRIWLADERRKHKECPTPLRTASSLCQDQARESPSCVDGWPAPMRDRGYCGASPHSGHGSSQLLAGMKDFGGQRLNVLQIGMGTFGNFIQNLTDPWEQYPPVTWLLKAASNRSANIRGVGVEPVWEHAERCRWALQQLPNSALVQAAVGTLAQSVTVYTITPEKYRGYIAKVPAQRLQPFVESVLYLQNMSCVGQVHPEFWKFSAQLERQFGVKIEMEPVEVAALTYGDLSRTLNFSGVEVLMIDAEGHDCQILRTMIDHCNSVGGNSWPDVIQFETMGHSDKIEGFSAENDILRTLKQHGYEICCYGTDTQVVNVAAYNSHWRVQKWLDTFACVQCGRRGWSGLPYSACSGQGVLCEACDSLYQVFGLSVWQWEAVPGETQMLSITTDGTSLWGVRRGDGQACRHVEDRWIEIGACCNLIQVAPEADGQVVWGLTADHQLVRGDRRGGHWKPLPDSPSLHYIAVSNDEVWGLDEYGCIHVYCPANDTWRDVPGLLSQVSISKFGEHIWGVNYWEEVYYRGAADRGWTSSEDWKFRWVSVSNDGRHVWGLTSQNTIFYRAGLWGRWLRVPGRLSQVFTTYYGSCVWGLDAQGYAWAFRM